MSARNAPILFLLVLACAVILFLRRAEHVAVSVAPSASRRVAFQVQERPPAPSLPDAPRAETRLPEGPAGEGTRDRDERGRTVLVLRADTGAPVRGASVVGWPGPKTIASHDGF